MTFVGWKRRRLFVALLSSAIVAIRHGCLAFTRDASFFARSKRDKGIANLPTSRCTIVPLNSFGDALGEKSSIDNSSPMLTDEWGGKHATDARVAARLVSDAVKLCKEYQLQRQDELEIAIKNSVSNETADILEKIDGTPVTALDFAIQGYIVSSLKKHEHKDDLLAKNDVSFLGEEDAEDLRDERHKRLASMALNLARSMDPNLTMGNFLGALDAHGKDTKSGNRSWILDPIDGTRGLLQGKQYCIGLGLCIDGSVVVGVLGNPSAEPPGVMVAIKNHGLMYYNRQSDEFVNLPRNIPNSWHTKDYDRKVSNVLSSSSSSSTMSNHPKQAGIDYPPYLLSMGPKTKSTERGISSQEQEPPAPFGPLCRPNELCCGSLVKYYAVASGQVAGFVQLSPSGWIKSWDHAPGMLCVQESGGSVMVVGARKKQSDNAINASSEANPLPLFDRPQFFAHDGIVSLARESSKVIREQIIDSVRKV